MHGDSPRQSRRLVGELNFEYGHQLLRCWHPGLASSLSGPHLCAGEQHPHRHAVLPGEPAVQASAAHLWAHPGGQEGGVRPPAWVAFHWWPAGSGTQGTKFDVPGSKAGVGTPASSLRSLFGCWEYNFFKILLIQYVIKGLSRFLKLKSEKKAAYQGVDLTHSVPDAYVSTNTKNIWWKIFCYADPSVWNNLPQTPRHPDSASSFKAALKTHLFNNYF